MRLAKRRRTDYLNVILSLQFAPLLPSLLRLREQWTKTNVLAESEQCIEVIFKKDMGNQDCTFNHCTFQRLPVFETAGRNSNNEC